MVLGVGRSATYELVRSGRWPTRVVRLGRRIVIPTALLLDLIGVDVPTPMRPPGISAGSSTGSVGMLLRGGRRPVTERCVFGVWLR